MKATIAMSNLLCHIVKKSLKNKLKRQKYRGKSYH